MTTNSLRPLLVVALLVLGLGLSACGGGDSTPSPTPSATTQTTFPIFPGATPITPGAPAPNPFGLSVEDVDALLTLEDVQQVVALPVQATPVRDVKSLLEAQSPEQVLAMDSWFSRTFLTENAGQAVSFSVVDYRFDTGADGQFNTSVLDLGLVATEEFIGDGSAQVDFNAEGADAILIVYFKGDIYVELQSVVLEEAPETRIIDMAGLAELAKLMAARL